MRKFKFLFSFRFLYQVAFLLTFGKVASAQVSKIEWGPATESERKIYPNRFIGKDERAIFFLKDTYNPFCPFCPRDHYLEKFDAETMSLIFSKEIKMPSIQDNRHLQFEEIFLLNGKLLVFSSFYNKENKESCSYVCSLNAQGEFEGSPMLIDRVILEEKRERNEFNFVLSADSSLLLEFKYEAATKTKRPEFSYIVLDQSLNRVLEKKNIVLPFINANFKVHDFVLDNTGNFYMLAELEGEKNNWFKDRPSYMYKIILLEPNATEVKEFDIQLEGKTISDMSFKVTKNLDLIAAGFFSNRGKYVADIAGTFYLKLDGKTKEVKNSGLKEFDKSFLMQFISASKARRGDELREFKIDRIFEREDGGAFLVAEQRYVQTINSYNGRYTTVDYYYNFNDLIVASIASGGNIDWVRMVPKTQVTVNDKGPYSSYSVGISGNGINFIFNDNTRNLKIPNPADYKTYSGPKKSTCVLVTIDERGNMQRKPLFGEREQQIFARPKVYLQTAPKELMMYSDRGRTFKLLKIQFN